VLIASVILITLLALYYATKLGQKVERSDSYKAGLAIHSKINKTRADALKKRDADLMRLHDNPRDVFDIDDST